MEDPASPRVILTSACLLRRFGDRWDIRRELSVGILTAEHRSPDGRHIRFIAARSAAELAAKLDGVEAEL